MLKKQNEQKLSNSAPICIEDSISDDKIVTVSQDLHPYLSIVIPCYNEQERILGTLGKVWKWANLQEFALEVLVVDDGSEDDTCVVVEKWMQENIITNPAFIAFHLLKNPHKGKAYTVRSGMLAAIGQYILFTDADLSTPVDEVTELLNYAVQGYAVVIGSREGLGAHRFNEPVYRHLMGRIFNLIVRIVLACNWRDTQCGFKLLSKEATTQLFGEMRLYGVDAPLAKGALVTGFDVELLFLAQKRGYRIKEVPVDWVHSSGSKVNPFRDSLHLLFDVLKVRWNSVRGAYKS